MHLIWAKSILSQRNGMNLYRGCQHGCIYCDSRSRCYQMDHLFEDIAVKENAPQLLEAALKAKRHACMIGTGSMTDPYLPAERDFGLTRKCLEIIYKYGFGVSILTKSDLVLRDLDLLAQINERTKTVLQMTLTTVDDALCKVVEPNVCLTSERVSVLKRFHDARIGTVVWFCPILPFINDTRENIVGIVEHCAAAGVKRIVHFGMGLTLRDGSREHFYKALDVHFPGLKNKYMEVYGNAYELPSPNSALLESVFRENCNRYGIICDNKEIFHYLSDMGEKENQLSFF